MNLILHISKCVSRCWERLLHMWKKLYKESIVSKGSCVKSEKYHIKSAPVGTKDHKFAIIAASSDEQALAVHTRRGMLLSGHDTYMASLCTHLLT